MCVIIYVILYVWCVEMSTGDDCCDWPESGRQQSGGWAAGVDGAQKVGFWEIAGYLGVFAYPPWGTQT